MDNSPFSPTAPRFAPRMHIRNTSQSPTRKRFSDDLLSDLSPATTLEAFTSPSGKLRASIEAATPSERAFGIRATTASKKIQEWVYELSNWPWPREGGSVGFEMPVAKRRRLSDPSTNSHGERNYEKTNGEEPEYIGSLVAEDVDRYEIRIEEIQTDMEGLNVEDIKRQVLDTHSPRSRPSSSASNTPTPQYLSSFTKMDDFTAIVTSTVLQSLPNLSRLTRLMDVWSIRLSVLRKVPPLLLALEDTKIALKSGWNAIQTSTLGSEEEYLSRETYNVMKTVLREKVTALGQNLDFLLDTLEGRGDCLPDSWLDRMEAIEIDYGDWDVAGDRKVREGEWAVLAKRMKEEDEAQKAREADEAETARLKAEQEAKREEERMAFHPAEDKARRKTDISSFSAAEAEHAPKPFQNPLDLAAPLERTVATLSRPESKLGDALPVVTQVHAGREDDLTPKLQSNQEAHDLQWMQYASPREAQDEAEQEDIKTNPSRDAGDLKIREAESTGVQAEQKPQMITVPQVQGFAHQNASEADEVRLQTEEEEKEEARDLTHHQPNTSVQMAQEKSLTEAKDVTIQNGGILAERQAMRGTHNSYKMQNEEAVLQPTLSRGIQNEDTPTPEQGTLEPESGEKPQLQELQNVDEEAKPKTEMVPVEPHDTALQAQEDSEVRVLGGSFLQFKKDVTKHEPDREVSKTKEPKSADEITTSTSALPETFRDKAADVPMIGASNQPAEDGKAIDTDKEITIQNLAPVEDISTGGCPTCSELEDVDAAASLLAGTRVSMGSAASRRSGSPNSDFSDAIKPSISRFAPFDGGDDARDVQLSAFDDNHSNSQTSLPNDVVSQIPVHLDNQPSEDHSTTSPRTTILANQNPVTPNPRASPFGHPVANALRRKSSTANSRSVEPPTILEVNQQEYILDDHRSRYSEATTSQPQPIVTASLSTNGAHDLLASKHTLSTKSNTDGWVGITSSDDEEVQSSKPSTEIGTDVATDSRSRPTSLVLPVGYTSDDPTPEIQEAEPAEYFQPVLSPMRSDRSPANGSEPVTPSKPFHGSPAIIIDDALPKLDGPGSPGSPFLSPKRPELLRGKSASSQLDRGGDDCDSCDSCDVDDEIKRPISAPGLQQERKASRAHPESGRVFVSHRESIVYDTPIVVPDRVGEPSSPIGSSNLDSPLCTFPDNGDTSPSAGRKGLRMEKSYDLSPPGSPSQVARKLSPQRSLQSLIPTPTSYNPIAPATPIDAPSFESLDVTTTPVITSPKKATTDEQIQQQISSILENIPARIRLTSEPTGSTFTSQTLRPKKVRRSITPTPRPSSTMSNYSTTSYSRATTPGPQFTLAPAFSKTTQRTRTHSNGNPEIKLYHLSRSTGEAPIKLFVRLVGEHGERVMVRVGGGWADLGEYLIEYASHHGRRSTSEANDKVEIQDLPSRNVSNSSTTSTIRESGRNTPIPGPRPYSVLERERPGSSLNVRKTRKSIGDQDKSVSGIPLRVSDSRSPSTPLPISARRPFETPPSTTSVDSSGRSSSRMGWTDEGDSSLGLAGPKSKKTVISEKDQEWVESMKEKVRLASAEKERKDGGNRDRGSSFGELEKVGGTKRLFRKG